MATHLDPPTKNKYRKIIRKTVTRSVSLAMGLPHTSLTKSRVSNVSAFLVPSVTTLQLRAQRALHGQDGQGADKDQGARNALG